MNNLLRLWASLTIQRRIIVVGATVAMFAAILGLSRLASTPRLELLYAGLDAAAAGEVVAALDSNGAIYEVRGDSIYIEAAKRDVTRMALASEGLPAAGGQGYELLDGLTGFGTTSQMFDAAYWRAKEGELARTVLANPQIKSARVHIAQAPAQPFRRDVNATASVTVTTSSGNLPPAQANAIRHLIAAAVTGMRPEDVQVIDSVGGLIAGDEDPSLSGGSVDERSDEIRQNVERILAARVGPGKAVVEVSLDVITDRESITERTFDPQGRVAISSETEEKTGTSTNGSGDVTVASNLPDGQAANGSTDKSENAETRERVNYEVSETKRELLRGPGSIRKLSVAVLVDGQMVTATDGTQTWQPRAEEELAVLRELVASAVGLDTARGDVLTLKSLQFEPLPIEGTSATSALFSGFGPVDVMSIIQMAVMAVVALILGLFVIRPLIVSSQRASTLPVLPAPLALPSGSSGTGTTQFLTGEIDDERDLQGIPVISGATQSTSDDSDAVTRLRRLIEDRQAESVEILRGWMELEEERR